jgi:hypothetical protein
MNAFRWLVTSGLALLTATVPLLRAQQNPPHIGYVYPAGGEKGTSFRVSTAFRRFWSRAEGSLPP